MNIASKTAPVMPGGLWLGRARGWKRLRMQMFSFFRRRPETLDSPMFEAMASRLPFVLSDTLDYAGRGVAAL